MSEPLTKSELWKSRIKDYRASGLTARKFCDLHQINLGTLRSWIVRLNKEEVKGVPELVPAPLSVTSQLFSKPSSPICIKVKEIEIEIREDCPTELLKTLIETVSNYV